MKVADLDLPTGSLGEVHWGIPIEERNRATTYETRHRAILDLISIREFYRRTEVPAVVFGVTNKAGKVRYAVFVVDGFLKENDDE